MQQAMDAYRKGGAYRRAVELARTTYPTQVGTYLSRRLAEEALGFPSILAVGSQVPSRLLRKVPQFPNRILAVSI